MLLLRAALAELFALILPVHIPLRVHAGLEGKALLQIGEDCVLANHRVLRYPRDEVPAAVGILRIIQTILQSHLRARVGEDLVDHPDDLAFLFLCPVACAIGGGHQGNADGVQLGPADPAAGNMAAVGF